jgi:hypothetical protein
MCRCTASILAVVALSVSTAEAQLEERLKFGPDDGAPEREFGFRLSLDGSLILAGVHDHDAHGEHAGAAYVFDTSSGAQLSIFVPDDISPGDFFGLSVALSGSLAIVGAPMVANRGAIYIWDLSDPAHPLQLSRFAPGDVSEDADFGASVALSGTTAIVGAPHDDVSSDGSGSAYLLDVSDPSNPAQIAKLAPADARPYDSFGKSVAIDGGLAVGGAPDAWNGNVPSVGAAYVFDAQSGQQLRSLRAVNGHTGDNLGESVAIEGNLVLAGAHQWFDYRGAVYAFSASTGEQYARILADDSGRSMAFGYSLDVQGPRALLGSAASFQRGAAYLFDLSDPRNPAQLLKLVASDGHQSNFLGSSVDLDGPTALVGAPGDDAEGAQSGAAYLYDLDPCRVDLNGDAVVDTRDVTTFLSLWASDDPIADWTGDGDVNTADVSAFLNDWVAGC